MSHATTTHTTLYYLADPRTPRTPRYVGITSNVSARAQKHGARSSGYNAGYRAWKDTLLAGGITPRLVVLRQFETPAEARAAEWRLIRRWQRRGFCDLNAERGGADAWRLMCAARLHRRSGVA